MKTINSVRFHESGEVDGTLITEVKQGKDGASIKLADRMKALEWIANHMDLATPEQRARINYAHAQTERLKNESNKVTEETADDGFMAALARTAAEDWEDEG